MAGFHVLIYIVKKFDSPLFVQLVEITFLFQQIFNTSSVFHISRVFDIVS